VCRSEYRDWAMVGSNLQCVVVSIGTGLWLEVTCSASL
jgi:hypothetical protein